MAKPIKFTADFNYKSATVTAQGENQLFYLANVAFTYSPEKLSGWSFALRGIDILASNQEALNTRVYNSEAMQIFYQEVEYFRYGPILEFGVNYAINTHIKSKKKSKTTFGHEQF